MMSEIGVGTPLFDTADQLGTNTEFASHGRLVLADCEPFADQDDLFLGENSSSTSESSLLDFFECLLDFGRDRNRCECSSGCNIEDRVPIDSIIFGDFSHMFSIDDPFQDLWDIFGNKRVFQETSTFRRTRERVLVPVYRKAFSADAAQSIFVILELSHSVSLDAIVGAETSGLEDVSGLECLSAEFTFLLDSGLSFPPGLHFLATTGTIFDASLGVHVVSSAGFGELSGVEQLSLEMVHPSLFSGQQHDVFVQACFQNLEAEFRLAVFVPRVLQIPAFVVFALQSLAMGSPSLVDILGTADVSATRLDVRDGVDSGACWVFHGANCTE